MSWNKRPLLLLLFFAGIHAASAQDTLHKIREVQLRDVTVRSPYVKLKEDSALRRIIYRKSYYEADFKITGDRDNPLLFHGPFTKLALALSGKQKRARKFKETIAQDELERYVSIRYNPAVVARVTGLPDSSAQQFIARNPMPRAFVQSAGELEFLQWIRDRQQEAR